MKGEAKFLLILSSYNILYHMLLSTSINSCLLINVCSKLGTQENTAQKLEILH